MFYAIIIYDFYFITPDLAVSIFVEIKKKDAPEKVIHVDYTEINFRI